VRDPFEPFPELSQHEVEGRLHWFDSDRRAFLKVLGGGVLVCLCPKPAPAQESGRVRAGRELPRQVSAWIHVGEAGRVTVFTGKVEIGQNVRTSLTQQVAEELAAPLDSIDLVMGDTDRTPFDMGTFGSRTTPTMGPQLRAAAAAAREALKELAARRWGAAARTLAAKDGRVLDPASGRSLTFGELTRGQDLVHEVEAAPLSAPKDWKVAGTPARKVMGRDFVTGRHRYSADLARPGMLHGKVLRPAGFEATLGSVDVSAAQKMPGVTVVKDGDFLGVAAADLGGAERALSEIKAEWKEASGQPGSAGIFEHLKKTAEPARDSHVVGSVDSGLAAADVKLSRTYTIEYIAHAPLEPRAALAEWEGDRLSVSTGTQRPFAVREELASAFRIPVDKVRVQVPDTGSAYGGKHTADAAVEAARLARASGKPVKVIWSREEEFMWAYFRPAGVIDVVSGARKDGALVAWEFHNTNSGPAAIRTPYDVPNQKIQFHPASSPLRQGSYRGLAATANVFARESHMDELAHELALDALTFRMKNLSEPRLRAVFEAAADRFGWGKSRAGAGRGFGVAGGIEKGSYVATCAEVAVDPASRQVRLVRVVEAFECGAVVNPDGLKNQVEGAIVQGIGGALFEAIRFENGRIENPHFAQYRVPRFPDVPKIEIVVLDRKDLPPAGAGETPLFGLAPAVAAGIFAATGVRLRGLPLCPSGVPAKASS
jgi:nicotinate dehydrogenase subunit B